MKEFLSVPNLRSSAQFELEATSTSVPNKDQILNRFHSMLCEWSFNKKNGDPMQLKIAADRVHNAMCGNQKTLDLRGFAINNLPGCIALLPKDVELFGCYEKKYFEQTLNAWAANPANGYAADREEAKKRIKRAFNSETLETLLNLADLRLNSLPDCMVQLPDGLHLHVANVSLMQIALPQLRSKVFLGQPEKPPTKISKVRDKKLFKLMLKTWAEDVNNGSIADRKKAKERIMHAWNSKTLETLLDLADLDLKTLPNCISQLPAGLHLHVDKSSLRNIALPERSKFVINVKAADARHRELASRPSI